MAGVEQRSGIIGSDAHQQVADGIGDVVISVFSAEEGFRVPYTPSSTVDRVVIPTVVPSGADIYQFLPHVLSTVDRESRPYEQTRGSKDAAPRAGPAAARIRGRGVRPPHSSPPDQRLHRGLLAKKIWD
eukprot:scaffold13958_cov46-Cyclotella_meneghiniana.AAC.2